MLELLHYLGTLGPVLKKHQVASIAARQQNLTLPVKSNLTDELYSCLLFLYGKALEFGDVSAAAQTQTLDSLPCLWVLARLFGYVGVEVS